MIQYITHVVKNQVRRKIYQKFLFIGILFLLSFSLRLWHLNDMGRTWDEHVYVTEGYTFIELIKKGDFRNDAWFTDSALDVPPLARYIYGAAVHLDNPHETKQGIEFNYDWTHARLISVLFSSLSIVLVAMLGWEYISPQVGIIAGTILATLPFFLGLSQLVTLESMIMFFFTATFYSFLRFLKNRNSIYMVLTGIFIGIALEIKLTNIFLIPLLISATCTWHYKSRGKITKSIILKYISIILISVCTFLILWPSILLHFDKFLALTNRSRFTAKESCLPEVFFGRMMCTPIIYYGIYFLITTPLLLLASFFYGLKIIYHRKKRILYIFILWFLIPFLQSIYPHRQNGIRYIIEIYAPFSLIAAMGIDGVLTALSKKIYQFMFLTGLFLYIVITLQGIAPYYLNYFNGVVGGTKNVYEKRLFHIGWWGDGGKESIEYLERIAPYGSTVGVRFDPAIHTIKPSSKLRIAVYNPRNKYDFIIVNYYAILREGFNINELRSMYKLIHTVNAGGAHLVEIYKKS